MIGHCFNPACRKELLYLRQGSVYQWETGIERMFRSEFFWLCPNCTSRFEVGFGNDGLPLLAPSGSKGEGNHRCFRIRRVLKGVLQECPVANCPARLRSGSSGITSDRVESDAMQSAGKGGDSDQATLTTGRTFKQHCG